MQLLANSILIQLFDQNVILLGIWETIYMTVLSTAIAYLFGLPLGIVLIITEKDGLHPIPWLNKTLGFVVNAFRSFPFIILMVAFLPISKALIGTRSGNGAMIIMLIIAATPYVARMVESSLKEVDKGVVEAARSMGASNFQIICKVYLPEAKPSLIVGAVISTITVLGYSAMAGEIGGGGLGKIAITYGYQRFHDDVIWVCVAFTAVIVELIQEGGMLLARKLDHRVRQNSKKSKNKKSICKEKIS